MDLRELKALELAARSKITFFCGTWLVPSQSGNGTYKVTLGDSASCTCPDFELRQKACKHVIAARLVAERDGGESAPNIDTTTAPKKVSGKQNWSAYNEAQITEKGRFYDLLAELRRDVPEPPYKGGRFRTPMADVVFACAAKVFSTVSSRRFGTDLADAHDRGFLSKSMHPNKVNTHLENPDLYPILKDLIAKSALPLRCVEVDFAADSTGFSTGRHVRWFDEKYGVHRSGKDWVKLHCLSGVLTNIVTAIEIRDRDAADSPQFRPLVEATVASGFKLSEVSGDKAYLSRENLDLIATHGGTAFIPFKSNSTPGEPGSLWEKMYGYFQFRRDDFLKHYHKRSNAESTFSMMKAKFGDAVRSRTDSAMRNEAALKVLCHNLVVVHQAVVELGIEPVFWKDQPAAVGPAVLRFPGVA